MDLQQYAHEYQTRSNDELLRLALCSDELVPEAQLALSTELSTRGLKAEQVAGFREKEEERQTEVARDIGQFWLLHPYGIGRKRFGRADYKRLPGSGREQFICTVFVVLFWVPLIPTGTYRIETGHGSDAIVVLEKLPLGWDEVLKVWAIAAVSVVAIHWGMRLLLWRLVR